MIKRFIAVLAALALMLSMTGCVTVGFSGGGYSGKENVEGKGEMTAVSFPCGDFSKLIVKMDFNNNEAETGLKLYYTAEKSDNVTFELQENLAQYLTVSNDNGTLTIDSEKSFRITDDSKIPKVYVSAPMLEKLSIEGAVQIERADKITADLFEFWVSGVCSGGSLDLEVKDLDVVVSGVSDVTLRGTAGKAYIKTSGVGSVKAFDLKVGEADVEVSGVGEVTISCIDKLKAMISGVGGIRYKGDPEIWIEENGLGKVEKAD